MLSILNLQALCFELVNFTWSKIPKKKNVFYFVVQSEIKEKYFQNNILTTAEI